MSPFTLKMENDNEKTIGHRIACHRCQNMRPSTLSCSKCPQIFCTCCVGKLLLEHGENVFMNGCPVCKKLCCCADKTLQCSKINHCYKKCPTKRNPDYIRPCYQKRSKKVEGNQNLKVDSNININHIENVTNHSCRQDERVENDVDDFTVSFAQTENFYRDEAFKIYTTSDVTSKIIDKNVGHNVGLNLSDELNKAVEYKDPSEHRVACHRCSNIRKYNVACTECPHIFCISCVEKMKEENGMTAFEKGCPVCKYLCCCADRSKRCCKVNHCYKKCPTTKNPNYVRPCHLKGLVAKHFSPDVTKDAICGLLFLRRDAPVQLEQSSIELTK